MNKRPLLSVALLLVLVILGLKFLGMPLRRDIPREKRNCRLPSGEERGDGVRHGGTPRRKRKNKSILS